MEVSGQSEQKSRALVLLCDGREHKHLIKCLSENPDFVPGSAINWFCGASHMIRAQSASLSNRVLLSVLTPKLEEHGSPSRPCPWAQQEAQWQAPGGGTVMAPSRLLQPQLQGIGVMQQHTLLLLLAELVWGWTESWGRDLQGLIWFTMQVHRQLCNQDWVMLCNGGGRGEGRIVQV